MQQKNPAVGFIYGDVGSAEFNFAIDGQNIQKFDYIFAPHKEGNMLAQVMDIKQHSDLHFDNAATIMKSGGTPAFTAKLTASAGVIGYRDKEGILQVPRTPFSAGTAIMRAEENLIRNVLGLSASKEEGAYIGLLKGHSIRVFLSMISRVLRYGGCCPLVSLILIWRSGETA